MLAGIRRPDDLRGMQGVRCAQHQALDACIPQHLVEGCKWYALLGREACRGWIGIDDLHRAQLRARLDERDDDAAPPAQATDSDVEHQSGVAFASLAIRAQRPVSAATYFAKAAGLSLVIVSAPPFFRRAITSASFITCTRTGNRRSITSRGVPAGTKIPCQEPAARSG